MADAESDGVEVDGGPVGGIPFDGGGTAVAGPSSTTGPLRRSTRSAALGSSRRLGSSNALASFFSSSEEVVSATDGDDDAMEDGDTDYTQTRGSDDDAGSEDNDSGSEDSHRPLRGMARGRSRNSAAITKPSPSRSRSVSPSLAYSEGGYTSGFTTGDESGEDLFDEDLDPLSLLEELEQQGAVGGLQGAAGGTGAYGGGTSAAALQPFELIRERRRAHRMAAAAYVRRGAGGVHSDDGGYDEGATVNVEGDVDMEDAATDGGGAGPSSGAAAAAGGRGRGRGRSPATAGAAAARGSRRRGRGRSATASTRRRSAASDVFGADVDDILNDPLAEKLGLIEPGSRRRGRGRGRGRVKASRRRRPKKGLPEEVVAKLGQANVMYALRDYQPAIELLTQVIREYPNVSDPYHTLGLLHEANGNPRKALDFFMIAAHLGHKDLAFWKRLASMSTELGFYRQAVYCLTKAINRNRTDLDALWDRAVLYAQVGDTDKALVQFGEVGRLRPGDPEVPVMKARLHHQGGAPLKAIAVLEAHLRDHPTHVDLTHINILAELYMERGEYVEARALIERAGPVLCPDQALPLDLAVKSGLCLANTGRWEEADEVLGDLLREPVESFGDLYMAVGSALAGLGQHEKALQYLAALLEHPDYNEPGLWGQLFRCHVALGELAGGVELYRSQMQSLDPSDPRYPAAAISLAEMCVELGSPGKATAEEMIALLDGVLERHGGGARVPPSEVLSEELAVRLSQLYLQMNLLDRYVFSMQPAVESSLSALAADLARVNDPSMPLQLRRAILRRRMFERKGGRKGEGASETGSVFKGATRRDRRSARTREYDRKAAEVLGLPYEEVETDGGGVTASGGSGLEGSATEVTDGGGSDSGGDVSGGEGRRRGRGADGPKLPRGGLIGPSVLSDPAQAQVLLQLTRALALMGRQDEAKALLDRAIALVVSGGGGGGGEGGGGGGGGTHSLMGKRVGGPWFDRAVIDRLKLGQLELASLAAAGGLQPNVTGGSGGGGGGGGMLDAGQLAALKSLTTRWPHSIGLWNLYCSAHAQGTDLRSWALHITTLRRRNPLSVPLMLLQGHVYLLARQFRDAASEYFHAYRFVPDEPVVLLSLAVALLSEGMASAAAVAPGGGGGGGATGGAVNGGGTAAGGAPQPLLPQRHGRSGGPALRDRNRGVLAGFAFLQAYQKARGDQLSQEVAYNMGRAAHQLGLLHIAHHYYELALAAPPAVGLPAWQATVAGAGSTAAAAAVTHGSDRWDLRCEIAHNLVQLYRSSGSTELAREVMAKYLVF